MNTDNLSTDFTTMINENKGIICKVANIYCNDYEKRKDLTQEIILQLWLSFSRYDSTYKLSTWIYRVALNVSISFYRKESRRKEISQPILESFELIQDHDKSMHSKDNIDLLHQFISELKELDKALILLYLEEKPQKEIAEILGLSETNIATKIGRIKNQLKLKFSNIKE